MESKGLLVIFFVTCVAVTQIIAQPCIPRAVEGLTVTLDSILTWSRNSDDDCTTNYYMVHVRNESGSVLTFAATGTRLDINVLPICETYLFTVIPVSNENIEGVEVELLAKMPFPREVDLGISLFSVATRDREVFLEWQVPAEWQNCADRFRLTIYDEEADDPVDLYVYNNYITLTGLVPCALYIFGLRAIYNLESEGPYTSTRYTTPPASLPAPELRSIALGSRTIDLSWQLDSYARNRCAISSLTVNASPHFISTYTISDQISRPPISVRLTDLQPDTMYILNVTVVNTGGRTAPALVGVQTLAGN